MQEKQIRNPIKHYQYFTEKLLKTQSSHRVRVMSLLGYVRKARKSKKKKLAGLLLETHCLEVFCGNLQIHSTLLSIDKLIIQQQ